MANISSNRSRNISLVVAVVGGALMAGCSIGDGSLRAEADANAAASQYNWRQATPFAEKAYAAHPTASTTFNLANAYANTGQLAKAAALYEDVVAEGDFTPTNLVAFADGSPIDPKTLSPLSDEASRRLKLISAQLTANTVPLVRSVQ
jgi:hypothetical protein